MILTFLPAIIGAGDIFFDFVIFGGLVVWRFWSFAVDRQNFQVSGPTFT